MANDSSHPTSDAVASVRGIAITMHPAKALVFPADAAARRYGANRLRQRRDLIAAKTCGTKVHVEPKSTRQFCSLACYRRSSVETLPEKATRLALTALGIQFVQEARIGRYSIDFLLIDTAIEVDGEYWHQDAARDARKDAYLEREGFSVIRIRERELMDAPDAVAFMAMRLGVDLVQGDQPEQANTYI